MKKLVSVITGISLLLAGVSALPASAALSESTLKSKLQASSRYKMDGWVYRDFDGNGTKEGFAACVGYDEPWVYEIRFVDASGNVTLMTNKCDSYLQHDQTPVVTMDGKCFVSFDTGTGAGIYSQMFSVKSGQPYELKLSGHTSCLIQNGSTVYTYRTYTDESRDQVALTYDKVNQEFIKPEVYFFSTYDYPGSNHELSYYGGYAKNIIIPEKDYAGRTITTIAEHAFTNGSNYYSITIPKTVTSIGKNSVGYYYDPDTYDVRKKTDLVIRGYSGTTAETYAKSNGFRFLALDKESIPNGDLNSDGKANATDAANILIAAARLGTGSSSGLNTSQSKNADVNYDGYVNATDAAIVLVYAAAQGSGSFTGSFTDYQKT